MGRHIGGHQALGSDLKGGVCQRECAPGATGEGAGRMDALD